MNPLLNHRLAINRRHFFGRLGLGATALTTLLNEDLLAAPAKDVAATGGLSGLPHFEAKAKRVIYLFQSGAPSQLDLFDHKPQLAARHGTDLPDTIRQGQRLTGMTATQERFPIAPTKFRFAQHGRGGAWLSELLPHTARVADELCFIKTLHTEAINHDPAITFFQTGAQLAGRPSIGSWLSYGLGSMNRDLPAFVVLLSNGTGNPADQPLYDRLWSSGFLPTTHQGIKFRAGSDPVLFLSNPDGLDATARRRMLDDLAKLNQMQLAEFGDPEIATRIAQYELAYRMQTSVPALTDVSREPASAFELYGPEARKPGTFAANCLLARRLAERGVRFIQLFHRGWDQHLKLPAQIAGQCRDTDQPSAGLIQDLKQRGLLDDTLVVWGGEFGRTVYCQGRLTKEDYGRDHHPRCFTIWLAGGGIRPGVTFGETDDYSYNVASDPVHVHDLHATLLHCLGIDHTRLTFKFQGRHYRLTDVHGQVVKGILA
ncbi:MAG: DUF1501 domain-containing protein [Verrucomicrobia bacterium]|nr:DUF1501 domain-containing protein [Verrucomicrobiota bacterium]NBU08645.1 DUF1501 domain-containing protein [Pseudomonadota bacterium]NDA66985.1 DUF1501 domain-containing protein [Verrucomicrobiota bacterium]NDD38854.1 DUF1501 domain-containing protein [Verrucomicrobiota bacterium]NDE98772.1 DUF1501 domain-containing protein [Verrucomicrobiota bacterium]